MFEIFKMKNFNFEFQFWVFGFEFVYFQNFIFKVLISIHNFNSQVNCVAKVPRRAFTRGEMIPLTLEIDNQANSDISGVVAWVALTGKSRTGLSKLSCSRSINLKAKKVKEGGVPPSQSKVIKLEVPLDFTESAIDSNLIPAGTLSDCQYIDIKYNLNIKVKRSGMHRNIEFNVPIKVGNINSSGEAALGQGGLYPSLH